MVKLKHSPTLVLRPNDIEEHHRIKMSLAGTIVLLVDKVRTEILPPIPMRPSVNVHYDEHWLVAEFNILLFNHYYPESDEVESETFADDFPNVLTYTEKDVHKEIESFEENFASVRCVQSTLDQTYRFYHEERMGVRKSDTKNFYKWLHSEEGKTIYESFYRFFIKRYVKL